jgi:hypothetical protein
MYAESKEQISSIHQDATTEERRQRALQVLFELKFTFGMEELAREFLHKFIADAKFPPPRIGQDDLITERVLHRA